MSIRSLLCIATLAGLLAAPSLASAGADAKVFRPAVKTNSHAFYGVSVEGERCTLAVKVHYHAPKEIYDASTVYRFRVKVEFNRGGSLFTRTFTNKRAGSRVHYYPHNTTRAGCWARNNTEIKRIKVVSCAGKKCKLPKLR